MVLVNLLEYLFSDKKARVYAAFSLDDYYAIADKLQKAGIRYRVASSTNLSSGPGQQYGNRFEEYVFYVRKEDVHKANAAIHSTNP